MKNIIADFKIIKGYAVTEKCVKCGSCVDVCPSGAINNRRKPVYIDQEKCIKCGKCVEVCPMRLMPNALSMFSVTENVEKLKEYHVMDCMECGSCSFICPQRRFMVQHIKAAKAMVKKNS